MEPLCVKDNTGGWEFAIWQSVQRTWGSSVPQSGPPDGHRDIDVNEIHTRNALEWG